MPRRGGLRFVLVLTGLRRLDGDTIASRDRLWAIDLRLGIGPEDLPCSALAWRIGAAPTVIASGPSVAGRTCSLRSGVTTTAAAETLASPCSTARTRSGTPSSSSVLAAWTVARLTSNGLAASSCETASFRAVFARRPPDRRVSRAAVTARRESAPAVPSVPKVTTAFELAAGTAWGEDSCRPARVFLNGAVTGGLPAKWPAVRVGSHARVDTALNDRRDLIFIRGQGYL